MCALHASINAWCARDAARPLPLLLDVAVGRVRSVAAKHAPGLLCNFCRELLVSCVWIHATQHQYNQYNSLNYTLCQRSLLLSQREQPVAHTSSSRPALPRTHPLHRAARATAAAAADAAAAGQQPAWLIACARLRVAALYPAAACLSCPCRSCPPPPASPASALTPQPPTQTTMYAHQRLPLAAAPQLPLRRSAS